MVPYLEISKIPLYPGFDWKNSYNCNTVDFGFQMIELKRRITIPIVSDFWYYSETYEFDEVYEPDGYCTICNKDILVGKDLSKSQNSEDLDSDVELFFCDICKVQEYNKIRENLNHRSHYVEGEHVLIFFLSK